MTQKGSKEPATTASVPADGYHSDGRSLREVTGKTAQFAVDASKSGSRLGVSVVLALCSFLLQKHIRDGLIIVGGVNLGGPIEPVYDAVSVVELVIDKDATAVLMPVVSRRQFYDLSDDVTTKVDVQFYSDARDALLKAVAE